MRTPGFRPRPPASARAPLALAALLGAAACAPPSVQAPGEVGVCWRMDRAGERPAFRVVAPNIRNLESCAVRLEGLRMIEGGPVAGAYQGHFIFTDAQQITAATRLDGPRFSVFEQKARLEIQAGLRQLIEQQAATAPAPAP